jgi:hypothetical protein
MEQQQQENTKPWGFLVVWTLFTLASGITNIYFLITQLTFANSICLLFVDNYHKPKTFPAFIFDATSPVCTASLSVGVVGMVFVLGVAIVTGYYFWTSHSPARRMIAILTMIGAFWSFATIAIALIQTAGLIKTCSEFTKSSKSCATIFAEGFFSGTTVAIYFRDFTLATISIVAAWIVFLLWLLYTGYEWRNYSRLSPKEESSQESSDETEIHT